VTRVFTHELDRSALAGSSEWLEAPVWVVPTLLVIGWTVWAVAVTKLAPLTPAKPTVGSTAVEEEQLVTQGA
jgi:hypothetical protein